MRSNRLLILVVSLSLVVIAAIGGWLAGSNIISPAEAAARTAPPTPAPILVPVEERVLSTSIITRGTARFGLPQDISIVPSTLKADTSVITSLPAKDSQLEEGNSLLTISGRPVFILQGDLPVFRDFVLGLQGDDVRQLEAGLQRLGFDPGPVDGIYDAATGLAVTDWYTSFGWEPIGPTDEQTGHIRSMELDLADATNRQATAAAARARVPLLIESARATAESAHQLASAEVNAKTAALERLLDDPEASTDDQAAARAELAIAQATENAAQLAGQLAIQAALDEQAAADREFNTATDLVEQITGDLEAAQSEVGIQVPADEIVFLPMLPVRVDQLDVKIGDVVDGPLLTVTNNQLAVDSSLSLNEAPLVQPGMAVAIDEPELGVAATGMVSQVADTPGTSGVDGFHVYVEILVDETPVELDGFSLRLTIPVETTGGLVTTVPISALSLAADGVSRVQVDNAGTLEFVVVEPGLAADGYVEVVPVEGALTPGQMVVIGFENPV